MLVKSYSAAVNGMEVTTVTIEVSIVPGVMYHFTGLGDEAVKEGRNRIAAALQCNGYLFPRKDTTVNMAPATCEKKVAALIYHWLWHCWLPTRRLTEQILQAI